MGRVGALFGLFLILFASAAPLAPLAQAAKEGQVGFLVTQGFFADGLSTPPTQRFSYLLRPQGTAAPMPSGSGPEGYVFTMAGSSELEIGPMDFSEPGIYRYELSCTTKDMPAYAIDRRVYTIEVQVNNGQMPLILVYGAGGEKTTQIYFLHRYGTLPSDSTTMDAVPVIKTVNGSPDRPSIFSFELRAENPSNPMPAGSENGVKNISIIGAGQAQFGTWSYTAAGTYHYTVTEVNTGIAGYHYDPSVYSITDKVEAIGGQLVVEREITNDIGQRVLVFSFVNTYSKENPGGKPEPPGPEETTPPDKVTPPGQGPKTGDFSNPRLWTALIGTSAILLLFVLCLTYKLFCASRKRRGQK